MTLQASPEQNERYRAGLCIDCSGGDHVAGRPRCNPCDALRLEKQSKGEPW